MEDIKGEGEETPLGRVLNKLSQKRRGPTGGEWRIVPGRCGGFRIGWGLLKSGGAEKAKAF